jgi:hypothetical protein
LEETTTVNLLVMFFRVVTNEVTSDNGIVEKLSFLYQYLQFAVCSLQGSQWLVTRSLDPGLLDDINTNKLEDWNFGEEKDWGVVVRIWMGDLNFWLGKTELIRSMCSTAIRIPSRKLNCDVEGSQP